MKPTKEEFINEYCKKSNITREFADKHLVAEPCDCDYENCKGWQMVPIEHKKFIEELEHKVKIKERKEKLKKLFPEEQS